MKKIICYLLAIVLLGACNEVKTTVTASNEFGEKKIGDIIMVGGELGIVYAVTSNSQHGKAVSVIQCEYGLLEWEKVTQWCSLYGVEWRIPYEDELRVIHRKKDVLDSVLSANGYSKIGLCNWSSDGKIVEMSPGARGSTLCVKGSVRAVISF